MTTATKETAVCCHCGAIRRNHRGIDAFCPDQYATTFWNPIPEHRKESTEEKISRMEETIDRLCEEIEKLKTITTN
jgi:hypothetical protein